MHNKCTNFVISRCAHACILSSFGLYALLPSHCSSLEHHPHHHGVPRSTTSSPPALQPVCHKTRSTSAVVQAGHHTDPQRIVSVPSPLVLFSHHVIVMVSAIFSIIMITPVLPFALPTTIQPRFTHPVLPTPFAHAGHPNDLHVHHQPPRPSTGRPVSSVDNAVVDEPVVLPHQSYCSAPVVRTLPTLFNHTTARANSHALYH